MTQNKRVAVTGGAGSGKTAFCSFLQKAGYRVLSCDEISNELWREKDYRAGLCRLFPDCAAEGEIDRAALAKKVFSDKEALRKLNAYAHPRIMQRLFASMGEGLCFAEVPLLFEGGYEGLFDAVVALRRTKKERIAALQKRSGWSEKDILRRINAQLDDRLLEEKPCIVVENDGDLNALQAKALALAETLGARF